MSLPRGPLRTVLFRSGGYSYAELDLDRPVHLVAGNNVGKTTLISALQFLYIDNPASMHFSHSWSETKRHYFPESGSMVLFECMTPIGLQVFGIRGLGPVQGHEFQRFIYRGAYRKTDFLQGREFRSWDDVARHLVSHDLRFVEAKDLRKSLVAAKESKSPPFGLVPLTRKSSYDSFKFLFKNLLRLSKIDQSQLKRLFVDTSRPRLERVEVDLRKEYEGVFNKVERQVDAVAALARVAPLFESLVTDYRQRERLRANLLVLWSALEEKLDELRRETEAQSAKVTAKGKAMKSDQELLEGRLQRLEDSLEASNQEIGQVTTKVTELEELQRRVLHLDPDAEKSRFGDLQTKQRALAARVSSCTTASRSSVEERLSVVQRDVQRDSRLIANYASSTVGWVRSESGLTDTEANDVFRILNPELLSLPIASGSIEITDELALSGVLNTMAKQFDEVHFVAPGLLVSRRAVGPERPMDQFADTEVIEARLGDNEALERELSQTLEDIDRRSELERLLEEAELALGHQRSILEDWERWRQERSSLAELKRRHEDLSRKISVEKREKEELSERVKTNIVELERLAQEEQRIRAALSNAVELVQTCKPPRSWAVTVPADTEVPSSIDDCVRRYQSVSNDHRSVENRVDNLFREVHDATSGRYVESSDDVTILRLEDELKALPDKQRAVEDLWESLVESMRNAFKSMVAAVNELRRQVSRLNSSLNRRTISNLAEVRLELVSQRDLLQRLVNAVEEEPSSLFSTPDSRKNAVREISSWLEDRPKIEVADLFDLKFRVVDKAGQTKTFSSLSQIESQGTSTTIKVLVHLELLKKLLTDEEVQIPFFLDEVATLDEPNLGALIEHSTTMGFVPVIASPEPRDTVDTLYFLRPGNQGIVLDETSRVSLSRDHTHGS